MLKLDKVCKTYVSKSKQKVEALKEVSLEIGDSGMVFILGKSGSGKSTLLNLLGGLDGATGGEILVDGQSFADFKQADYDNYRNQYVGFVFQEFNLLNDFNVEGNVALALRLSKEKDVKDKVENALNSVGLSADYLTRKIDELSGGEKQRVAIARAIVKDSKLILADEPTGNLDSGTGESIWNILKDLSKSKLVIVVSHDRESAEKYGDRIIEISDGRIVADNGEQPTVQPDEGQKLSQTRKRLSAGVCFKMGLNNLLQRKVRSITVILLSMFTIFAVMLMQIILSFSAEKTFSDFITENGVEYIKVTQGKLSYGNEFRYMDVPLRPATRRYLEENSHCIENDCINSKQDILDMGLSFIGEPLEIDGLSVYLTSYGLEQAYAQRDSYVTIDGEKVKLVMQDHLAEFLIGKRLSVGNNIDVLIAGVVDTSKYSPLINGKNGESVFPFYFSKPLPIMNSYFNENFNMSIGDRPDIEMRFGNSKYSDTFKVMSRATSFILAGGGMVMTKDGMQALGEVTLADDEVVITYETYKRFFGADPQWSYVSVDLSEVLRMPSHIGKSFSLKFYVYDSDEMYIDVGSLKIAGVAFSYEDAKPETNPDIMSIPDEFKPQLVLSPNNANKIADSISTSSFLVHVSGMKNLRKFLVDFRKKHEGYVLDIGQENRVRYADFVYQFESELFIFKIIFIVLAVVLSAIMLLLVINLISFSILNRKREIGILSALGATNGNITKIFLLEVVFISVISFIVNFVAVPITISMFNARFNLFFSEMELLNMTLLRFDLVSVITLIVASFGMLLLAALLPLRKIIKLKPIDAIKNL